MGPQSDAIRAVTAEPHSNGFSVALTGTQCSSGATPAHHVQDIEHLQAGLNLDLGLHGVSDSSEVSGAHTDIGLDVDYFTRRPAALLQDTLDWTSMVDPIAPFDFSGFGYHTQLQMPPTYFPLQVPVPPYSAYPPIAPALTQANLAFNPSYLSGTDTGPGVNANILHGVHEPRIRCTASGCTKTFRRPGDYRRHMRKHQAPIFKCIDVDCDLKFYRMDKLRDHLR
jgi:hypothetical protein